MEEPEGLVIIMAVDLARYCFAKIADQKLSEIGTGSSWRSNFIFIEISKFKNQNI